MISRTLRPRTQQSTTVAPNSAARAKISSWYSAPVKLSTEAPACSAALATTGSYVSADTSTPSAASASTTGTRLACCCSGETRAALAVLDSAPTSTRSAPWAASTRPLRTAEAVEVAMLSR